MLASIAAQCADRDMIRYLLDGGPYIVSTLRGLRDDQLHGLWRPEWTPVPSALLDALSATKGPTLI